MILAAIAATAGAFVVPAGQNRVVALVIGRGVSPLKSTWNVAEQRLMRRAGGEMA
jgi:hypothetical protein